MSIIDDVRINQDLDKDGKYVCDLNYKEKIETRSGLSYVTKDMVYDMDTKFTLNVDGIYIPTKGTIPPKVLCGMVHRWLENSIKYSWGVKDCGTSTKEYISSLIAELQNLI